MRISTWMTQREAEGWDGPGRRVVMAGLKFLEREAKTAPQLHQAASWGWLIKRGPRSWKALPRHQHPNEWKGKVTVATTKACLGSGNETHCRGE